MRTILAVDPGPRSSGWVLYDVVDEVVLRHGIDTNETLLFQMLAPPVSQADAFVIEKFEARGMPIGESSIETIFWSGRLAQAWEGTRYFVQRRAVKLHLCGTTRAKDSNINAVLGDRFSGGQGMRVAKGLKKSPGPLYGMKSHSLAALAVAVTFADKIN